ncbi:MAG: hypothetical protein JOZ78_25475 [Chroococcidiopsidaceae cyanobacterium CP_BM_ER_R8_30]|nr:hypothetical protein [Chroococcidiopsidaceae cyanobacterium CP_BM_ER_R8_30]
MTIEDALVILDTVLQEEHLTNVQELVFCQVWEERTYTEIAAMSGYDTDYIKYVGCQLWRLLGRVLGEKVTKSNLRTVLRRRWQQTQGNACGCSGNSRAQAQGFAGDGSGNSRAQAQAKSITQDITDTDIVVSTQQPTQTHTSKPTLKKIDFAVAAANQYQDWEEAIDVSMFYGRTAELSTLKQWIVQEHCRLVAVFGMVGIGKTALTVKLAEQVQTDFEWLIWRSLRNAPPIQELLADLIKFLSQQQEIDEVFSVAPRGSLWENVDLPTTVNGKICRLIDYLRGSRCLLVLDNFESILCGSALEDSWSAHCGRYQAGYEGYGQLLRCVGEISHQSCLVLTSRETPKGFAPKLGQNLPVRALKLKGLQQAEAQKIFEAKGEFFGSDSEWRILIEHYAGNPLALKMVAAAIEDLFERSILKFLELLQSGTLVFGEIRDLLDLQASRLSDFEKQIMYWLAINREPISFLELAEDMALSSSQAQLMEALTSLTQRSLIEIDSTGFTQNPVVMDYITTELIEQLHE